MVVEVVHKGFSGPRHENRASLLNAPDFSDFQ